MILLTGTVGLLGLPVAIYLLAQNNSSKDNARAAYTASTAAGEDLPEKRNARRWHDAVLGKKRKA